MKVKNLNNSSLKTRKAIRDAFMEMLSEKGEIGKITVKELAERAEISRATFYAHFDDIYGIVEEFEGELINEFFTNAELLATDDYVEFFETIYAFMVKNGNNYRLMCRSEDFAFSAKRIITLLINKMMELVYKDKNLDKDLAELDISVFATGIVGEYVKFCRGTSPFTPEDLYRYSVKWYERFMRDRK